MADNKAGQNGFGDPSGRSGQALRRRAEEWMQKQSPDPFPLSPEEAGRLLHELQVHRIELEMQNEELRRAQREIEASRARYFDLYNLAPVGYFTLSEEGLILEANLTAGQLLGMERNRLARQPMTRFILRDDQDIYYLHRKTLFKAGERQVCEVRLVRGDGSQFWAHMETTVSRDNDRGEPLCRTVISDITERKQAELAMRASEARFKLLSEMSGLLLRSEDAEGIIHDLCRQVMEHLDCQAFFNFLVDEQAGRLRLNAWAGIPQGEARKIEWLDFGETICGCVARDGVPIVAEDIQNTPDPRTELVKSYGIQAYACHPLMVPGRLVGTLSFGSKTRTRFSQDDLALMKTAAHQAGVVLERTRLAGELQRSRDELENRVRERTFELRKMNEEQKTYMRLLEQSNRDLEEFAHVASHDLQEPLRKIRTFSDRLATMRQELLSDKARDYLERMLQAAGRTQDLVRDLLVFARIAPRPESFARFNLRIPVEEAVTDLGVLCEEAGGRIEVGDLPDIEADRVQMRQLFRNLMGNGLTYCSAQKPVIRVNRDPSDSDLFWEIHVEDNGIGFDECYLDRIFKPFQRLHGKDAPYPGTGMGLAISRRIVEHHGGSITARSKPGMGSTFIVKLLKQPLRRDIMP
jgi:PAS domain S-box-containing protein